MDKKKVMDINIFVTDDDAVNRETAKKILKDDLKYTDAEITEIEVERSTEYDAQTCGGGGVKNAPGKARYIYIGKSAD
jgi:hypothetical protein